MSKHFFTPKQDGDKTPPKTRLVRARSGPIRMRKSGAGFHASRTNRERARGQNEAADIRRNLDGQ